MVFYALGISFLLFFALTRTQVGREALRDQIVRQFDARFEGRLEIGTLSGNLVHDLYAGRVRVLDPAGAVVLSADSVVVRPSWRDLLSRTFSTGRITLIRPELHLVRLDDGRWTIQEAFGRETVDTTRTSWSFSAADVEIVDGAVTTRNLGTPPPAVAHGLVFDYASSSLRDVDARAVVDLEPGGRFVDVLSLEADLPDAGLALAALQGQFVLEDDRLALNGVDVQLGASRLTVTGTLDGLRDLASRPSASHLDLDLAESHLDHDELRALFPRLPLADAVDLRARLSGPVDALVVEEVHVRRGRSQLTASGLVRGLPDSIAFEAALPDARLVAEDVRAVLPASGLGTFGHLGTLRVSARADGRVDRLSGRGALAFEIASEVDVTTDAGMMAGTVAVARNAAGRIVTEADLVTTGVDVGRIARETGLASSLSGHVTWEGTGRTLRDTEGRLSVELGRSRVAGRHLDSLRLDVTTLDGIANAEGWLLQYPGGATLRGSVDLRAAVPTYQAQARTYSLDLGRILPHDSLQTSLNALLTLEGRGISLAKLGGTADVAFDPSTVSWNGRVQTVPAHRTRVELRQDEAGTSLLALSGDVATARLEGRFALAPMVVLGRLWGQALVDAVAHELEKPLSRSSGRRPPSDALPEDPLDAFLRHESTRATARAYLEETRETSQRLSGEVALHRSDILVALVPMLPRIDADLRASLRLQTDADRFELTAAIHADSLRTQALTADFTRVTLHASASMDGPLRETLTARLEAETRHARWRDRDVIGLRASADYADRTARLSVASEDEGTTLPVRVAAHLDILPDRNRLTLTDIWISARGYAWSEAEPGFVDLYRDAVVVPGLVLENRGDTLLPPQRIRIDGIVSRMPEDTLYAGLESIQLRQLSDLAHLKRAVGGRLDGRIALTGIRAQPEITGDVNIATLSFDNRVLGDVSVSSRYVPGQPDVLLDLALLPTAAAVDVIPGTRIPAVHIENRLHLSGTFRLPVAERNDPGALDLTFEAGRADPFFFEYLFRDVVANVRGAISGRGSIRGTFQRPHFDGTLALAEARFALPAFNLTFEAAGAARVDADGIHLEDLVLHDPTGGSGVISGGILFNDYRFFSFDLRGDLDDLQIMNVSNSRDLAFYGQIWASGHATLTGPISNALLRSVDAVTSPESNVFIPITETGTSTDAGFIVFADSTGRLPDLTRLVRRDNLLARRPSGEREFIDGLEMDLNILAPTGSTVHLVIDPLVGDVINAVGSGRIQLQRTEGEFYTFGTLEVTSGDYLFTAGEVFIRRFLIDEGTISWDGDPLNASLDITASYRTRASRAGLNLQASSTTLIPLIVRMHVTGRVATPIVDLRLAIDRNDRSNLIGMDEGLEAVLNQPERAAQYATSVLLTNSFLLTTDFQPDTELANTRNQLAFNSLSQLVASQLNRYLNQALPNLDLNFGVQGESTQDLDVTYGVALRLLDERLIIRGQGVYQNNQNDQTRRTQQGLLDEFVVEVRLNPSVSVEVFYRRENDLLTADPSTGTTGAGLSFETQFSSWNRFWQRLFGWLRPERREEPAPPEEQVATVDDEA